METIKNEKIKMQVTAVEKDNMELRQQIEFVKQQLIRLEVANGKKQIPVPGVKHQEITELSIPVACTKSEIIADGEKTKTAAAKEKKPKKEKPVKPASDENSATAEAPIDVGRLDFRVGKIVDVSKHPDADSLYLEKIDCGEANPRTVVSGLVKFIPIEQMRDRMVILLCNLKPAKMRGITSEAMVMCASTPDKVEILAPPANAIPGDLVHCEGYTRNPDALLNPKKKVFETCAPDLKTNEQLVACYKGAALNVPGKGPIVSESLRNVNVK